MILSFSVDLCKWFFPVSFWVRLLCVGVFGTVLSVRFLILIASSYVSSSL